MGIPTLWKELRDAAKATNIEFLGLQRFETEGDEPMVKYRLGVDASLWFKHSEVSATNDPVSAHAELRCLFFRICRLYRAGIQPLFVLDGTHRPKLKRNRYIAGSGHHLTGGLCQLLDAFGFEWHEAPGEAEAELAYLNRIGVIDAVLTDDVDALLFGAKVVIRNWGENLTGNKSLRAVQRPKRKNEPELPPVIYDKKHHVVQYTAEDLRSVYNITTDDLIFVALASGGDYLTDGALGIGMTTAIGLAACGFGKALVEQSRKSKSTAEFNSWLDHWREAIRHEMRTNEQQSMKTKAPTRAKKIQADWPSKRVLELYMHPATSEHPKYAREYACKARFDGSLNLERVVRIMSEVFEYEHKQIQQKLRNLLWQGVVTDALFRYINQQRYRKMGNPSTRTHDSPLLNIGNLQDAFSIISRKREHASTGMTPELRLQFEPASLADKVAEWFTYPDPQAGKYEARKARAIAQGLITPATKKIDDMDDSAAAAAEDASPSKPRVAKFDDPHSKLLLWISAALIKNGSKEVFKAWQDKEEAKERKKNTPKKPRKKKIVESDAESDQDPFSATPSKPKKKAAPKKKTVKHSRSSSSDSSTSLAASERSPRKKTTSDLFRSPALSRTSSISPLKSSQSSLGSTLSSPSKGYADPGSDVDDDDLAGLQLHSQAPRAASPTPKRKSLSRQESTKEILMSLGMADPSFIAEFARQAREAPVKPPVVDAPSTSKARVIQLTSSQPDTPRVKEQRQRFTEVEKAAKEARKAIPKDAMIISLSDSE